MIEIGGLSVSESYTEYAVEYDPLPAESYSLLVDCDDLDEARTMARNSGGRVLSRHVYVTEWDDA